MHPATACDASRRSAAALARLMASARPGAPLDATAFAREGMMKIPVEGPGVEILSISGEILSGESRLQAVLADADGKLYAGRLERGKNLTFITVELTLQEWLPD